MCNSTANDGANILTDQALAKFLPVAERIASALERLVGFLPENSVGKVLLPNGSNGDGLRSPPNPLQARQPSPSTATEPEPDRLSNIEVQLGEIRNLMKQQNTAAKMADRQFYTVEETAEETGLSPYTVRQACNKGRIKAKKNESGRWRVSHEEVLNIQNHGLPKQLDVE